MVRPYAPIAALLTALFHVAAAAAQPADRSLGHDRTLKGHTFIRPVADDGAFLPTSIGFRQGFFYVDAGSVDTFLGKKSVATAAALESLDTTFAFTDWLGVTATADVQAIVGASEVALYSGPSSFAAGVRFGPVVRLLSLPKWGTQVALRPYYTATFGSVLDVSHVLPSLRQVAAEEIASPPASNQEALGRAFGLENDLVAASNTPLRRTGWGGSLHVAQAFGRFFGAQVSYNLRRERLLASPYDLASRTRSDIYLVSITHGLTAAVTFDGSSAGVPLGVSFETSLAMGNAYVESTDKSADYDTVFIMGPGLHYTGRKSAQIGVFVGLQSGQSRYRTLYGDSAVPTTYYGQFTLRQFF